MVNTTHPLVLFSYWLPPSVIDQHRGKLMLYIKAVIFLAYAKGAYRKRKRNCKVIN